MEKAEALEGRRGLFLPAAAIFVFFVSLYSLTMQGVSTGGDARGMYLVTAAIRDRGSALLDADGSVVLAPCGDGVHWCSRFGIGQSVAQLPLYAAGKLFLSRVSALPPDVFLFFVTSFINPLLCAVSCVVVFLFLIRLGTEFRRAVFLCFLFGLGTLAWPYSKSPMSEPLQMLGMVSSAYFAFTYSLDRRLWRAVAAGFFCGVMLAAKAFLIVAAPVLMVYLAVKAAEKNRSSAAGAMVCFAGAAAPWVAAVLAYNYLRFGSITDFGYYRLVDRDSLYRFSAPVLSGVHGLLISSGKGLFFYVPAAWAALSAAPAFLRKRRAEAMLCGALVAALTLAYAGWNQWHGDFAWGPRFLVPLMPFIILPLSALEFAKDNRLLRNSVLAGLLCVSVFVQILGVTVKTGAYLAMAKGQVPYQIIHRPGDLLLRDDLLNQHFIPEFSPLAAHWWMLKHTALDAGKPEGERRAAMQSDFRWKTLLPRGAPQDPLWCEGFDFWFVYFRNMYPGSGGFVSALLVLEAALAMLAAAVLAGVMRKEKCG